MFSFSAVDVAPDEPSNFTLGLPCPCRIHKRKDKQELYLLFMMSHAYEEDSYDFSTGEPIEPISNVSDVKSMTLHDLRRHLRTRGVTPAGGRSTLQERLAEYLVQVRSETHCCSVVSLLPAIFWNLMNIYMTADGGD